MIKSYYWDKSCLPLIRFKERFDNMLRNKKIIEMHLKIQDIDFKRFMKVCAKQNNRIQSMTIRKQNTLNGLNYFILIEFFYDIPYAEIFEIYFSVLKAEFEIIKLVDKWEQIK